MANVPSSVCAPPGAPDPWEGKTLGKYAVARRLGKGGMGLVYEAYDGLLRRHVAIKLLPESVSTQPEALTRFLQEARAAGRLNHANVVAVYEVDQQQGVYYIVMELIRGGSAQDFLNTHGPFDWPEATQVLADVTRGLVAAHAAGLIHRDIKPSNVMRSAEGVVKLADFGLAKVTTSSSSVVPVTASGYTVGTPDYMSPEQCRAEPLDIRTDLYSLGATYYALLTGKPPFPANGPLQVMFAHCSNPIPDPRTLNAHVPERATDLIRRLMAKYPTERPASAAEVVVELERIAALVPREHMLPVTQWTNVEALPPVENTAAVTVVPEEVRGLLAPPQAPGELGRLGPYRVLRLLGEGGMGCVFQAEDPNLERLVALKVMKPDKTANDIARQRFVQEAKAAAAVQHEHIVTIYQVGEDRGIPYLAMQFLQGESLDDRLRRERRLPVAEILRIGREMAEGLAAAHERGLIHRDIKPANIWLEAPRDRVKVLDFGLARTTTGPSQNLTRTGLVMGTPGYMAPEQARGNQPLDHRCDLFSLGCVLYHLCTGQEPFRREDAMSTLLALALEEPPSIPALNPEVPPDLVELVRRMLSKSPVDRPASSREVVRSLADLERNASTMLAPAAAATAIGSPLSQARLAAHGLTPCDDDTAAPPVPGAISTPPGGHPQTTLIESLQSRLSVAESSTCPRCRSRLEGAGEVRWCLACGYSSRETKTLDPFADRKPLSWTWLTILLSGALAILAVSYAVSRHVPRDTMTRVWWSTSEVTVGVVAVLIGHFWAFFVVLPHRDDHDLFHYIDPTKLWYYSFKELPKTQMPLWLGSWGGVAILCAIFLIGNLSHWWVPIKPLKSRPGASDSGEPYAAAEEIQEAAERELPPTDDPTLDEERQRFHTQCVVIGYDEDKNTITLLVLATMRDGKLLYAGTIRPEANDVTADQVKEITSSRNLLPDPVIEGLAVPVPYWVKPKVTLAISYREMDKEGRLEDPRFDKPENALPKKPTDKK